jgi:hypothetical protein
MELLQHPFLPPVQVISVVATFKLPKVPVEENNCKSLTIVRYSQKRASFIISPARASPIPCLCHAIAIIATAERY